MSYFAWSPAFSIGLKKIDQQHKSLIQAVNALHEALHSEKKAEDLGWILTFLANYTVEHFETEEALMESTGFPRQDEHRRIHKELLGQVGEFIGHYQRGDQDISMELLEFLKKWLLVHIGEEDRRLGAHVIQHSTEANRVDHSGSDFPSASAPLSILAFHKPVFC